MKELRRQYAKNPWPRPFVAFVFVWGVRGPEGAADWRYRIVDFLAHG